MHEKKKRILSWVNYFLINFVEQRHQFDLFWNYPEARHSWVQKQNEGKEVNKASIVTVNRVASSGRKEKVKKKGGTDTKKGRSHSAIKIKKNEIGTSYRYDGTDQVGCILSLATVTWSRLLDVGAGEAQHSRQATDTPHVPKALILFFGERFIAWSQRCPFLGECRRSLRHSRKWRACLSYGPAPGPTFRKSFVPNFPV